MPAVCQFGPPFAVVLVLGVWLVIAHAGTRGRGGGKTIGTALPGVRFDPEIVKMCVDGRRAED